MRCKEYSLKEINSNRINQLEFIFNTFVNRLAEKTGFSCIPDWFLTAGLFSNGDSGDIVLCFAETPGRNPLVLLVVERHPFPHGAVDLLGHRIAPDAENELLGDRARDRNHGEFTFPGLAEPSFVGKFLDIAGTFTAGKAPGEGHPGIANGSADYEQKGNEGPEEYLWHLDRHGVRFLSDGDVKLWRGVLTGFPTLEDTPFFYSGQGVREKCPSTDCSLLCADETSADVWPMLVDDTFPPDEKLAAVFDYQPVMSCQ